MDTKQETFTSVEGHCVSMLELGVVFEGPTTQTLQNVNLAQLIRLQQNKNPEKEAVVSPFQGQRLTYSALNNSSYDISRRLYSHGVRPGHHVLVVAGNIIEYVQLLLAVGGLGAVFCIANPTFTTEEVLAAINFLEPTAIFVANRIGYRNNTSLLSRITEQNPGNPLVVQIGDTSTQAKGILSWGGFLSQDVGELLEDDFLQHHWAQVCPEATLCIQFTSGTTGPRKAAMASHQNLINNASSIASRLELTDEDIICCCPPISHCFSLVAGLLAAFSIGSKAVLPSDVFVAGDTLKAVSDELCTAILAVPTMLQALLDHPDASRYAKGMLLRTGINAGQAMSKDLALRLTKYFGLNRLGFAYGMTEASCIVFMTEPEKVSLVDDNTSVGYAMPHTFVAAVDDRLQILPPGSQGELLVSGYAVFQGYYKNPGKTAETLIKGNDGRIWLRTGDLVVFDPSGRCTITGRVKDMIKKGGENIFPADIEKALEQHPDIESAAVVGIQDPSWGENVGAFIKRKPEAREHKSLGKRDLRLWLRNRLAPMKMPEHVFLIGEGSGVPEEFPTNHTGKLLKAELRSIAERLVAVTSA